MIALRTVCLADRLSVGFGVTVGALCRRRRSTNRASSTTSASSPTCTTCIATYWFDYRASCAPRASSPAGATCVAADHARVAATTQHAPASAQHCRELPTAAPHIIGQPVHSAGCSGDRGDCDGPLRDLAEPFGDTAEQVGPRFSHAAQPVPLRGGTPR